MLEKVLVTGGAGFIGSHIVNRLIDNYKVSVLDNLSKGTLKNMNPKAQFYKGDILTDSEEIFKKERPDYLIHHAAQINVRDSVTSPINDANNNIIGSLNLFEACKKFGIKKIIFASSGGTVYGNPEKFPTSEESALNPQNPYAIAKVTIEKYLEFYFEAFGINFISLRYGNVYGPRQNPEGEAGVISVFIQQILSKKKPCMWGSGTQTRDFIYVKDVAEANHLALKYNGNFHAFNIGTEKETPIRKIFNLLKKNLNSKDLINNLDYKEKIQRVMLDCSRAKKELGWESKIKLEEGIKETIDWFKVRY